MKSFNSIEKKEDGKISNFLIRLKGNFYQYSLLNEWVGISFSNYIFHKLVFWIYRLIEPFFRKYRYVICLLSILLCALFIWVIPVHIGIRWMKLPDNILLYLLASFSGIAFILSISCIVESILILRKSLSFLGGYSLFILCMHWPIIRMLYDKAHISNNNIIAFVVGAIVCFTTAGIGVILKKYCRFFFK